jgi:3-dehydroquinate synthase
VAVIRVRLGDAPDRSYDVVCGSGVLAGIGAALREAGADRSVMVCDAAVETTHAEAAAASLSAAGVQPVKISVPSGETAKSVAEAARLWDDFARLGVDRGTHVVAVGGGVVGDLAGFVAASFMRGLPFWQVPTTLVAQVDSSVGGKTGINLAAGKNLVGAFWQPCGVIADIETLATLPRREFVSGLAEVVKYGMILDSDLFAWLEDRAADLLARDPGALTHVVTRSVQLKAAVVAADERETSGARAALNYGHTFGHAFEAVAGYGRLLHGEAVAIGMARAARLAAALGRIPHEVVARQDRLLQRLELPISPGFLAPAPSASAILDAMQRDKKTLGGQLRFVLPHRIGAVDLVGGVSPDEVRRILDTAG